MVKFKDLKGKHFGKLTVIEKIENKGKKVCWKCKCECGNYKDVISCHLLSGAINNCGCLKKDKIKRIKTKHGKSKTKLFRVWAHMKDRCYREKDKRFRNYGGRGIKICEEWLNKENGFINFYNWAIKNGYKENLSIDRIDNDGNYEPQNCRWTTMKVQANNTTRNHYLTYKGEKHTIAEWSTLTNIQQETIRKRLKRNWTIERTLNTKRKKVKKC